MREQLAFEFEAKDDAAAVAYALETLRLLYGFETEIVEVAEGD